MNIGKVKFLAKEAKLRARYMTSKDCIFCSIVRGDIKTSLIMETDKAIAFNDINPVSKVHVLIVPKRHIDSVMDVSWENSEDIVDLFKVAKKVASDMNLDAFRLAFNAGKFQHVPHLHMHLLSGGKVEWSRL
jgi:histidine triad (HIT) family protein